ncbi:hypothetical protein DFH06DRAFT_1422016 [Mycena polygramma]|nr:hypothetical protein DFH06DRAFT_1422016 [Mycena polygramma]
MKAKDERVALTNEVLGGIRMIKFMAGERNFEARLWDIRERELTRQKITYMMKILLTGVGNLIPMLFALASFGHYTVIRHEALTPSIAFTAITIFNSIQYAISGFPEALLAGIQCFVSLRRIDHYLESAEVTLPTSAQHWPSLNTMNYRVYVASASITWPASAPSPSQPSTPFALKNLSLEFPQGQLSLVCGKVGSGKSLLLLENILFELPYCAERYAKTLEVCALNADLDMLEYGDLSEVGERGINLSGGQKARVSLARAIYSRASIVILDDILSAVDVHTAHHLYHTCLKGQLMRGRTVILVSHHIQLCADGAAHIVVLDRGVATFQGTAAAFRRSDVFGTLLQTKLKSSSEAENDVSNAPSTLTSTPAPQPAVIPLKPDKTDKATGKAPKFVVDEISSVGRIPWAVWTTYLRAAGTWSYWLWFASILFVASLGPVFENGYLRTWADAAGASPYGPIHYLSIYGAILCIDLMFRMVHFLMLYTGSINACRVLYKRLLETVLFSDMRFHDTVARGSLLNRFGKDMQIIDGYISDDFGRTLKLGLSVAITFATITVVGGLPFLFPASVLGIFYYFLSRSYARTSPDLRRLVSTTTSPLYSIYDTAVSGVIRHTGVWSLDNIVARPDALSGCEFLRLLLAIWIESLVLR